MLSQDLNVKDFKLPVDGKSGTGGLWMTHVVPPVLLNQGYSPPCKFGYTIYVMLTNGCYNLFLVEMNFLLGSGY